MLGPFATTSRLTPIHQVSPLYCRTPPAHRCPRRQRRQRQRVTEGTAMAPWNGPNKANCRLNEDAASWSRQERHYWRTYRACCKDFEEHSAMEVYWLPPDRRQSLPASPATLSRHTPVHNWSTQAQHMLRQCDMRANEHFRLKIGRLF